MSDLAPYQFRLLVRDGRLALYRGTAPGGETLLLATALAERPPPQTVACLENEYAVSRGMSLSFAAPALKMVRHDDRPAIILADPGGEPLAGALDRPFQTGRALRIAASLAGALDHVHAMGLVHGDLRPEAILVDAADATRLTGFGNAARVSRRHRGDGHRGPITVSPATMAPEQTGRLNRAVDNRSDLYSLGVVLYRMLTGALPFAASDLMEWVHAHVARQPIPIGRWTRDVPGPVAEIAMTLLAKSPEERYQTAGGLRSDLLKALALWEETGEIDPFPLRRHDNRDHVVVPDRLYGREDEIAGLVAAFDRVSVSGQPALALVSGHSGAGKTVLVDALFGLLAGADVRLAAGKFDQLNRGAPYATLVAALRRTIEDILAADEPERLRWKARLGAALGANGGLIVGLIPQLERLIGPQPPVPALAAHEAQNRFEFALQACLAAFATAEHPLVLFLDDLQWIDQATARLLVRLLAEAPLQHLLLIGAYRSNEVGSGHLLARTLDDIRAAGQTVSEFFLAPLSSADIRQLTADALGTDPAAVGDLAELIAARTAGNPFFAVRLLADLVERAVVVFDPAAGVWRFCEDAVRAARGDDLPALMLEHLHRLSPATLEVLERLACLGIAARTDLLGAALGCPAGEVGSRLAEALAAGLVFERDGGFAFLHDQVQEAAYGRIPVEARARLHLAIGRALVAAAEAGRLADATFETANQIGRALDLIEEPAERLAVARLNLAAAAKASAAAGYAAALDYLAAGTRVLGTETGAHCDRLRFEIDLARGEALFLNGEPEAGERLLAERAESAGDVADRARIAWLRVTIATAMGDLDRAVALCLAHLAHAGIRWSAHPSMAEVEAEFEPIRQEIVAGRVEERLGLAPLSGPGPEATMAVLTAVLPPAFFTDLRLVCLVLCRMANISAAHGNTAASALGYAYLGMVMGPVFGDYGAGYRFGKLGIDLLEKPGFDRFRGRTLMTFAYHVLPYSRPFAAGREPLRRAFELARESGDLTYAGYSSCTLVSNLLASGEPLAAVERQAERSLAFVRGAKFGLIVDIITTQLMLVRALRGLTFGPATFADGVFDETAFEARLERDPALRIALCWHLIRKLEAHVFAGDTAAALRAAARAEPLLWTTGGHLEFVEYHFYDALARADAHAAGAADGHLAAIEAHRAAFATWAENAPGNFLGQHRLINAELARLGGDTLGALRLYDEAAQAARAGGLRHIEALAHERAAAFCRAERLATMAEAHLSLSRAAYRRWGADGKLRLLEEAAPAGEEDARAPERGLRDDVGGLDVATLVRSSEALSGEVALPRLVRTLMSLALENAGAQRGVLLLKEGDALWVEAEAIAESAGTDVTCSRTPAKPTDVPIRLVDEAIRTRSPVMLSDGRERHAFADDPYFTLRRPRSILALPLVRQGKARSLIYLENDATPDAFTPARLAVLRLIAAQAAISLENAILEEKESLLKEVHHRVKNNLQLITSLLSLQAARSADPAVAEQFAESRNRVRSMALVHDNLYRAGSFARISMGPHLRTLCAHLRRAYVHRRRPVGLTVDADDVTLDLDRAVSCGLIVNELVSNALKHAFAQRREGRITVTLRRQNFDRCSLVVEDDGIGLPADWQSRGTLGLQLVDDLTNQLRGHLDVTSDQGTTFTISFDSVTPDLP